MTEMLGVYKLDLKDAGTKDTVVHLQLMLSVVRRGPRLIGDMDKGLIVLLSCGTGCFFEIMSRMEEEHTLSLSSVGRLGDVIRTYRKADADPKNPIYTSLALGYCLLMVMVGRRDDIDALLEEVAASWGDEMVEVMASGQSWHAIMSGSSYGEA